MAGENSALARRVTAALRARLQQLQANFTNTRSYGCYNATMGRCAPELCTAENNMRPCLDTDWNVDGSEVANLLLQFLMGGLEGYVQNVTQVTTTAPAPSCDACISPVDAFRAGWGWCATRLLCFATPAASKGRPFAP